MRRQGFLLGAHECELTGRPWLLIRRLNQIQIALEPGSLVLCCRRQWHVFISVSIFGDDELCLGWAWLLRPLEGVGALLQHDLIVLIVDDVTKIRI